MRVLFLLLPLLVAAAPTTTTAPTTTKKTTLRVLVAQSLDKALRAEAAAFEAAHAGVTVEVNAAGSQVLVTQLVEGARADVVATADDKSMGQLVDGKLVEAPRVFARNRLVLVVPAGNPAHIRAPQDLQKPGVKLVLAGDAVPAGRYARAALTTLGLLDATLKNVVSFEGSVAGVMTKVNLGAADAGIAYATDVVASRGQALALDLGVDVDVRSPVAVLRGTAAPALAAAFVDGLLAPAAQQRLRAVGFLPP